MTDQDLQQIKQMIEAAILAAPIKPHSNNGIDSPLVDKEANLLSALGSLGFSIESGLTNGVLLNVVTDSTVAAGDVCLINTSGHAQLAKADAILNASGLVMATASFTSGQTGAFLAFGVLKTPNISITAGALVFLSITGTTGNTLTTTAPSATNNVIQILGWGITTTSLFFNPCLVQVEHT